MSSQVEKEPSHGVAMRDGPWGARPTAPGIPSVTPAATLLAPGAPMGKDLPSLLAYGLVANVFALVVSGFTRWLDQDCRARSLRPGEVRAGC